MSRRRSGSSQQSTREAETEPHRERGVFDSGSYLRDVAAKYLLRSVTADARRQGRIRQFLPQATLTQSAQETHPTEGHLVHTKFSRGKVDDHPHTGG